MNSDGKEIPTMIRKYIYNLIIILVLLAMTGCSVSNILPDGQDDNLYPRADNEEDLSSQPSLPSKGGVLKIAMSLPDSIHPLFTKSKDFINFSSLIYEGLFAFDEDLNLLPALAKSWEVLDEGKIWQIELNQGVRWHNGDELTAKDVKYTFDLLFAENAQLEEEKIGSYYAERLFNNRDIARVEFVVNNPYAITIVLNKPAGRTLLEALTFPILPARDEEEDDGLDDINSLIGTGPYKIESGNIEIGNQIKLVRNEAWWGSPQPYIDTIVAKIYKDSEESLEAFRKGQVDLVDTHVIYAEFYGASRPSQLHSYLTQNFVYIGFNHNKTGVLSDKQVRKAIAYGIDRKDIISRVYANNAQAVDVPIPPDVWYYDSDLRVYDYQPLKAKELLEETGWSDINPDDTIGVDHTEEDNEDTEANNEGNNNEDKEIDNNGDIGDINVGNEDLEESRGLSFTINVNMDNVMHKEALNLIVGQLAEVGIDVKPRLLSWDDYKIALEEGDFEAFFGEYYPDLSTDLRLMFHSSYIDSDSYNYIGYSNPELDGLLDKITEIENVQEFKENYNKVQTHIVEELPIISLYYRTSSLLVDDRIHGIKTPRELMIFRNINEWFIGP